MRSKRPKKYPEAGNGHDVLREEATENGQTVLRDAIYCGDSRELMKRIEPGSIALSFWSPPYHVGKEYEKDIPFAEWQSLLKEIIQLHSMVLKPGGFLVINIADILCFRDETMPRIQAPNVRLHRSPITREQVLEAKRLHPNCNRDQLAKILGCSEQTIDRRINGNNIRGGKYSTQTRVKVVGGFLEEFGLASKLYLYDHRIWAKDPTWANSQWHSSSYRAVSEYEDLYVFWKPGETVVDRHRLSEHEWSEWGSRAIWNIRSVRSNDDHPAKFPVLLAKRVIRLFSDKGDTVLDPFLGSGTTAVAAIETGRHYIGIEKDEQYVELARRRIGETDSLLIKSDY